MACPHYIDKIRGDCSGILRVKENHGVPRFRALYFFAMCASIHFELFVRHQPLGTNDNMSLDVSTLVPMILNHYVVD
ncbi:hypothetical protein PsorP6_011014 [Peronosclerospora sorghi]|uniref:Uncharacterized protein n=1 Tax=Peronosclerospora sorghi TaxID=230839 RepID=A0ACC0VVI5_9STRA|nr:hypothetical protein PsorP6_011014 [Peronosclerospora sorghi]